MAARKDSFESSDRKTSGSVDEKINAEVEKIIENEGKFTQRDISQLRKKYKDESIVDGILKAYSKRQRKIRKQAKEIAAKIAKKYRDGTRPLHEILDRMLKYKNENKWSSFEFDEFRKELYHLLTGDRAMEIALNQNLIQYRSRINSALGAPYIEDGGLSIKDSEHGVLNEILSMYDKSLALHKAVFMQGLIYDDCSLVSMTGEYKREKHIASNHIHPLIACMFLPKISIFELQMLYSNFGSIIKSRYEGKPIVTEPDSMLFYDLIYDPNDVVCEINSPITDIRNRYQVQINLWETVMKLRNGSYYDASSINEFLSNLNKCRNNLFDNADLAYSQDEGAIMRRLMSVFSLRPTIITVKPIYSVTSGMYPFMATGGMDLGTAQSMLPFNNQPVYTVTQIPMITYNLPPRFDENSEPKDLKAAQDQTIWINEGKTIVPKEQSIVYSKEVLIFYVNRRIQRIQIKTFANPLTFSQLPLMMNNFERLNKYPVHVPDRINLKSSDELFHLRSVVVATETEIVQTGKPTINIITGSCGLIAQNTSSTPDSALALFNPKYWLYDPLGASLPVAHPDHPPGAYFTNKPISQIDGHYPSGDFRAEDTFFKRACHAGTIFIYAKTTGFSRDDNLVLM